MVKAWLIAPIVALLTVAPVKATAVDVGPEVLQADASKFELTVEAIALHGGGGFLSGDVLIDVQPSRDGKLGHVFYPSRLECSVDGEKIAKALQETLFHNFQLVPNVDFGIRIRCNEVSGAG